MTGQDPFGELLEVLIPVVRERSLSLDDAWAVVAAVVPVVRAEALREAANLIGGNRGPCHGVRMADEVEWAQWLHDLAAREAKGDDR